MVLQATIYTVACHCPGWAYTKLPEASSTGAQLAWRVSLIGIQSIGSHSSNFRELAGIMDYSTQYALLVVIVFTKKPHRKPTNGLSDAQVVKAQLGTAPSWFFALSPQCDSTARPAEAFTNNQGLQVPSVVQGSSLSAMGYILVRTFICSVTLPARTPPE